MVQRSKVIEHRTAPASRRRSIVVGTDFSSGAGEAIARAVAIARSSKGRVDVVHAAPRLPRALARAVLGEDHPTTKRESEELAKILTEIRSEGAVAHTHLLTGSAVAAVRSTAHELVAAMVVVGARGRLLPDAVLGSTAERIATTSPIPVLLVRNRASQPYRQVLVAADVASDLRRSIEAASLAAPDAELSILHAYQALHETTLILHGASKESIRSYRAQARRDARTRLEERIVEAGADPSLLLLRYGDPRQVLETAEQGDKGVLLVIERGRSVVRHALLGSVCRWVVAHGVADVLLV